MCFVNFEQMNTGWVAFHYLDLEREGGLLFTASIFSRKGSYKHRDKASGEPKFISKGDMKIEKKMLLDDTHAATQVSFLM